MAAQRPVLLSASRSHYRPRVRRQNAIIVTRTSIMPTAPAARQCSALSAYFSAMIFSRWAIARALMPRTFHQSRHDDISLHGNAAQRRISHFAHARSAFRADASTRHYDAASAENIAIIAGFSRRPVAVTASAYSLTSRRVYFSYFHFARRAISSLDFAIFMSPPRRHASKQCSAARYLYYQRLHRHASSVTNFTFSSSLQTAHDFGGHSRSTYIQDISRLILHNAIMPFCS